MCLDPVMWPLGHFSLQLLDPCSAALTPPFCIACSAPFWLLYKTQNPALFLACSSRNVLFTFPVLWFPLLTSTLLLPPYVPCPTPSYSLIYLSQVPRHVPPLYLVLVAI